MRRREGGRSNGSLWRFLCRLLYRKGLGYVGYKSEGLLQSLSSVSSVSSGSGQAQNHFLDKYCAIARRTFALKFLSGCVRLCFTLRCSHQAHETARSLVAVSASYLNSGSGCSEPFVLCRQEIVVTVSTIRGGDGMDSWESWKHDPCSWEYMSGLSHVLQCGLQDTCKTPQTLSYDFQLTDQTRTEERVREETCTSEMSSLRTHKKDTQAT